MRRNRRILDKNEEVFVINKKSFLKGIFMTIIASYVIGVASGYAWHLLAVKDKLNQVKETQQWSMTK